MADTKKKKKGKISNKMNELRIFLGFRLVTRTSLETNRYKNICLQIVGHFTFNDLISKLLFMIPLFIQTVSSCLSISINCNTVFICLVRHLKMLRTQRI